MKKFNMKKNILTAIILTAVMACVLLYVLLIDFSYDEDLAIESVPTILVQPAYTTDYEELEKLKDSVEEKGEYDWTRKKPEEEKDEYDWTRKKPEEEKDDNGDGQVLSRRQRRRSDKARQNKSY